MSSLRSNYIYFVLFAFFQTISHLSRSEDFSFHIAQEDSIIKIYGYVYDSITEGPDIIPVKAQVVMESQPFGSEIGIISSQDTTGYYEYYINLKHIYRIEVNAKQYMFHYEELDARKIRNKEEFRKDFYLTPEFKKNQIVRLNKLIFEQAKADITKESYTELDKLVRLMNKYKDMVIQLEGHTDYRGSKKLNLQLSEDRVIAVKNYLIKSGVSGKRIKTKAYGGTRPLTKESSIEASEINRRVEFRILKLE